MDRRKERGDAGEALAAAHLEAAGFTILGRNVRAGGGEIDIVASCAQLVVFCEVRTRSSSALIEPAESVGRAKIARIRRAAASWLREQDARFVEIRFDVASVVLEGPAPRLTYYQEAF